ncbi:MAG: hypothetical protein SPG24_00795 [Collinsella sp.]|nr:hypothetical protein [Collinsella sp.]MCI6219245.1 hypothetical protein [Collinsella sp.]MCI6566607.1 hypothetical protein [Collinsella sp.]MDD6997595.1 hypothetical protein [Collinsella sp.]MDY4471789.1 hypothetical protein [Collinsella sp.]
MKIDVDVDQLRESLLDRAGSAVGVGFPAAMLDVVDIEDESPQELLARAEREGLDLRVLPSTMTRNVTRIANLGRSSAPAAARKCTINRPNGA